MITESIVVTDFNNNEHTIVAEFHLSKRQLIHLEARYDGGLEEHINELVARKDPAEVIGFFENIIRMSYGKTSDDGLAFIQNDELSDRFIQSIAYDELLMSFLNDEDKASRFVSGILPKMDTNPGLFTSNARRG